MPDVVPIAHRDQVAALVPLQAISMSVEAPRQRETLHYARDARFTEEANRATASRLAGGAVTLDQVVLQSGRPAQPMMVENDLPDPDERVPPPGRRRRRRGRFPEVALPADPAGSVGVRLDVLA